jgi:hypothetical protein
MAALSATVSSTAPASDAALSLEVRLTARDLFRADRSIVWRKTRLLLLFCTAVISFRAFRFGSPIILVSFLLLQGFCLGIIFGFVYLGARSTLRTNKMLRGAMHYTFDDQRMSMRGETFWGHTDWCNIHEAIETRHSILIRPSSMQKYVLPKRFFAPGDLRRLRDLVRAQVQGSVKLSAGVTR